MTSNLDAGGHARDALSEVAAQAPAALSNASLLANLLKDLLPDASREAGVLVTAVQAGASELLRDRANQVGGQLATVQVAGMLEERTGLSTPACQWAVTELAVALRMLPGGTPSRPAHEPPAPGGPGPWAGGAPTAGPGGPAAPASGSQPGGPWAGGAPTVGPGGPAASPPGSQPGGQWAGGGPGGQAGPAGGGQWAGGAPTVGPGGPAAPASGSQPGGQWAGGGPGGQASPAGGGQWAGGAPTVGPGGPSSPAGGGQYGGQWAGGAPTVGPGAPVAPASGSQPGGQWGGGTPTTAPGSYGQGPTVYGQPAGGGAVYGQPQGGGAVYGQGPASPGFYGQSPAGTAAPSGKATRQPGGGLAVTAGVAIMVVAVLIAWYSLALPFRLGAAEGTWFAIDGLAAMAAGLLAVLPGRVRQFGSGATFGTATYLCGLSCYAASYAVGLPGYASPAAAAVLTALVSAAAAVISFIVIARTAGLSARAQGPLAAAWVIAAICYAVVWVPNWAVFPGEGATIYTGATGGEKFGVTLWLLSLLVPLLVSGLVPPPAGAVRTGIAVGWLALLGAEQLTALPVFLAPGFHATGWLYAAWVVWLAVLGLTIVAARRDRATTGVAMQPSAA